MKHHHALRTVLAASIAACLTAGCAASTTVTSSDGSQVPEPVTTVETRPATSQPTVAAAPTTLQGALIVGADEPVEGRGRLLGSGDIWVLCNGYVAESNPPSCPQGITLTGVSDELTKDLSFVDLGGARLSDPVTVTGTLTTATRTVEGDRATVEQRTHTLSVGSVSATEPREVDTFEVFASPATQPPTQAGFDDEAVRERSTMLTDAGLSLLDLSVNDDELSTTFVALDDTELAEVQRIMPDDVHYTVSVWLRPV